MKKISIDLTHSISRVVPATIRWIIGCVLDEQIDHVFTCKEILYHHII